MFDKSIVTAARFLKMPTSSRLLYYDLGMNADDDGVAEAWSIMRMTGANEDDLRVLISKGFLKLLNEDLVVYIMDWSKNNFIRHDRYKPGEYHSLLVQFQLLPATVDDNQVTTKCQTSCQTSWQPNVSQVVNPGKDRDSLGKDRDSLGKSEVNTMPPTPDKPVSSHPPSPAEVNDYLASKNLNRIDAIKFVSTYQSKGWLLAGGIPMMDWRPKAEQWAREDALKNPNGYTPPDPNDRYNFNSIDMDTLIDRI